MTKIISLANIQYITVNCIIRQNQTLRDYSSNITYLEIPFLSLNIMYVCTSSMKQISEVEEKFFHVVFIYLQMLCNKMGIQSRVPTPPPLF
jgi:hypothetical protein